MAGKFFALHRVTDFAPGYFENTAMEDGSIQLGRSGGVFLNQGTYTSKPFMSEAFFNLLPSWNAETPPGTSVEMQVRITSDGKWSQWFSFGKWSPFIRRQSPPGQSDSVAQTAGEYLTVAEGCPAADMVQMRVLLQTEDTAATPRVRLLCVSTNAPHQVGQEPPAYDRLLALPAYSARNRDPSLGRRIASLTSLVMMMNRWGADVLPEEVARVAYDAGSGDYGNLAFLCAAAATFGYRCQVGYTAIAALRREVWQGRAVAARVHYRAPSLGEEESKDEERKSLPPILEGATQNSNGHLVAVHGFTSKNGTEYVVFNDPAVEADKSVTQEIPVVSFAKIFTGIAVFMQPGAPAAKHSAPKRRLGRLLVENGTLRLLDGEEEIAPARLDDEDVAPATICYTLSDGVAYASAAQRTFYYPGRDEGGHIPFDVEAAAGKRIIFYVFGSQGKNWVAEYQIPAGSDS